MHSTLTHMRTTLTHMHTTLTHIHTTLIHIRTHNPHSRTHNPYPRAHETLTNMQVPLFLGRLQDHVDVVHDPPKHPLVEGLGNSIPDICRLGARVGFVDGLT